MSDTKRSRKGDGSIYERKINGKIYWVAKYTPPQLTKPLFKYGKSEAEAKRLLREMKREAVKHTPAQIKKNTVKSYMENWLTTVKVNDLKPTSYDRLEMTLNNSVFPIIGDFQVANLQPNDIQMMVNTLKETPNPRYEDQTLSYSTIKKAYDAVNSCFKWGVNRDDIDKNPCRGIKLPEAKKKKTNNIRFFNDKEIEAVTNTCLMKYANGKMVYRIGHGILFLMYTGLRIGEFLALTWDDVDLENKRITVRNSVVRVRDRNTENGYKHLLQDSVKTDAGDRFVPLHSKAVEALKELQAMNGKFKNVASSSKGNIVHAGHVDKTLRSICIRSGVEPCGVHVLRHTYASLLFRNGVDVKVVSKILGHGDISVTYNTYIHLIQEQEIQAVSMLNL